MAHVSEGADTGCIVSPAGFALGDSAELRQGEVPEKECRGMAHVSEGNVRCFIMLCVQYFLSAYSTQPPASISARSNPSSLNGSSAVIDPADKLKIAGLMETLQLVSLPANFSKSPEMDAGGSSMASIPQLYMFCLKMRAKFRLQPRGSR